MEEDYVMIPGSGTKKIIRDVKKEIETAFLDYSMSVIVSRALPDVRDGLKPVHRRILYTMHERGNDPSHAYRKSADTVGAVLGSYHPHGDASVYDAMVRLAQDFSLRYPLVDGQGNFGSVDGDPPAAYRYTEARMSRMAVEMLTDIDKDTIDWDPNFDETKKEPSVLPCRFPNLLVNGSQGIAVGMATNIPPHNLSEVIDGCVAYIEDPDIDLPGLMEHIKGPDFPTAGIIMGRSGIRAAYATGRGKITLRGRATIEEKKNGRAQIIVTEIPYMVNKARLIENIADLVKEKRIEGISDLNDETNRKGMRIVIDVRKDANPQVVLNQLYQYTQLQDTVALGGQKEYMCSADLKEFIETYHLDLSMDGNFNPRDAFGSHDDSDHVYNTPRAWFMERYLNPHTKKWDGPNADYTPVSDDIPWMMVPEKKITVEDVKYVLSSHYQGTPYDPYAAYGDKSWKGAYRSIGVNRTDFLSVIQMRPDHKGDNGILQWIAFASNAFNVLVPFYTDVTTTPEYLSNTTGEVSTDNFYWASRMVAAMADASYKSSIFHIERYQEKVMAKGHALIHQYDALLAGETDETKQTQLREEANNKIAEMLKKETGATLHKVLFELSNQMKNAYSRSDA